MSRANYLAGRPNGLIFAISVGLALLIGWLDCVTGWEFSAFIFYAIPILLTVWYLSRESGVLMAVLCAGIWWAANQNDNPYLTSWGYLLASFNRFVYFTFVAVGGWAIKTQQDVKQAQIDALKRGRELEQKIVQISEYEQRRIGQDLHDGLCQELASIGFAATMLKEDLMSESRTAALADAEEIERLLQGAVVTTRNLARGIFPVQMEASGLVVALEELAQSIRRLHRINVSLETSCDGLVENPDINMHLYRIAQEAVGNAVKHGKAQNIAIRLSAQRDRLELRISDDGTGIPAGQKSAGMGLRTMKYRSQLIGAELTLDKGASGGVIISLTRNTRNIPQAKDSS